MKTAHLFITLFLLAISVLANNCFIGEYYDNNQGSCQQCDISCATCSSSQGCTSCYTQMYLKSQGNSVLCDLCYNVVKHCQICISSTKCKSCSNGYLLDSNSVCQSCSSQLNNCLFCFQNSTILECVLCNYTHTLVEGTCVSNDPETNANENATGSANSNQQTQESTPQSQQNLGSGTVSAS